MYIYIHIYSELLKTIQCTHPPHHHNGLVATGHSRIVSVRRTNRVLKNTRQGAKYIYIYIYIYI